MNKRAFIFLIVIAILSGCTPSAANLKDQAIETVGEDSIKTSVDATLEAMREDATATPISDKGERGAPPPPPIGSTPSPESSPPNETGETCNPKKYMGVFGLDERVTFTGEQDGSSTDIYVMDANSWEKLPNTSGGDTEPKWSRDGSRIAYVSDGGASMGDIFVMGADGHNRVKIANTLYYEDSPVWSPDGEKIAFTSDRDGNWDIFVMEADGSDQTNITNSPSNEYSPTWSPDGSRIAFSSDLDGFDIYVINANGSNLANITNSPEGEFDPSWSPDAGKIAFSSDRDGTLNIHIMHSDGSNNTNLTYNSGSGQSQEPEWSPDESRIVFSDTGPCGHSAIWVMDSDGENIYLLWEFPNGDSYSPHWEPEESTAIAADVSNLMTIIGRVVWNNQPVSTAKIVAGIGGSPETATNVTTSPVDSEGYFSITYDGAEEHTIWVLTPDDEYLVPERAASLKEMREQITTVAGTLDLGIIGLEKKLRLITPDNGASTTTTPTFTWEAIPSAVNYHVIIDALDVGVSIEQYEVGNVTEFELTEPLTPDIKYTWYVTAFSDSGWTIASNISQFFKVVSSDNVTTVTGRAMWHDQPLAEVNIFAVPEGSSRFTDTRTAVGSVDADGWFAISFSGSVPHTIWVTGIDKDKFWDSGRPVEPDHGQTVDIGNIHVAKKMTLLTPEQNAWTTLTPTFTWEAFPNAVNYHIDVFDTTTDEAVLREDTGSATEYTAETLLLNTNRKYEWSVHAESASGIQIAYYSAFYFWAVEGTLLDRTGTATPIPVPTATPEVVNYDLDIIRGITPDGAYHDGEPLQTVVGIRGVPYEFIGWEIEGADETAQANIAWGDGEYLTLHSQELMQNSGVITASHIYSSGGVYFGYIDVVSNGNSVANSSFTVFINEVSTETTCDATNPYDFIVSGFSFQGENDTFRKVDNLGNELGDTCGVEGLYQRPIVENFYHKGIISQEDGEYFWNNMGRRWQLYPEFDLGRFSTGPNNPYLAENPYFTLFRGDADVTTGTNRKQPTNSDNNN